jgi:hypothetical protein
MNVFSFSEAGGHPENEDAWLVERHPSDPDLLLVAIADGQGGQSGGGRAARVAVRAVVAAAVHHEPAKLQYNQYLWREILHEADDAVLADPDAGFTTLIGFAAGESGGPILGASSGDSAVLLVNGGEPVECTSHQYKNPPVGSGEARFVPFSGTRGSSWRVLAMTDGVWKYAGWETVREESRGRRGQAIVDAIAARARLPRSGAFPDDFTLVLVESDP